MASHFTPAFYTFFRQLKSHNNREWFLEHRDRYVADVEAPMLQFITDVGTRLPSISKMFKADARRFGGSMYRIYRDTRFSADKTPYKNWAAAHFKHRAASKEQSAPGFYLHIGPAENFGGGGIYHPEMPALTRIRQHIVASQKGWAAVVKAGIEIEGDTLTRPPAGFDGKHRFIEDLKRKDYYAGVDFTERQVTSAGFLDVYMTECERIAPLMSFLCGALGLKF